MRAILMKWGNNTAVRLPAAIVKAARLKLGQPLEVREENGRVIIEPADIRPSDIDVEALCATLDPAEQPEFIDLGPPAGREVW